MKKTRSETIKEIAKQVSDEVLSEFEDKETFRKVDIEMIIMLAVARGYQEGLKGK